MISFFYKKLKISYLIDLLCAKGRTTSHLQNLTNRTMSYIFVLLQMSRLLDNNQYLNNKTASAVSVILTGFMVT
jgi:hypothetical protein